MDEAVFSGQGRGESASGRGCTAFLFAGQRPGIFICAFRPTHGTGGTGGVPGDGPAAGRPGTGGLYHRASGIHGARFSGVAGRADSPAGHGSVGRGGDRSAEWLAGRADYGRGDRQRCDPDWDVVAGRGLPRAGCGCFTDGTGGGAGECDATACAGPGGFCASGPVSGRADVI